MKETLKIRKLNKFFKKCRYRELNNKINKKYKIFQYLVYNVEKYNK